MDRASQSSRRGWRIDVSDRGVALTSTACGLLRGKWSAIIQEDQLKQFEETKASEME